MPRYLLSRSLYMLPVIWLVVSVVFLLIHLVPGDPIQQMLGEGAAATDIAGDAPCLRAGCAAGATVRELLARPDARRPGPLAAPQSGRGQVIAQAYPSTLELTLAALLVAIALAIPAGVRSALRRNRWDDRVLSVVSLFGLSFPNFALGPVLILFFAVNWDGCRSQARARWRTWCFPRSPWAARWRPSSPAWCAPRCSKNLARITSAPRVRKACPSARWFIGTRCATP